MGLLKKIIKAYKDDRRESQAFLARVEAHKAREAALLEAQKSHEAALAAAPKKYSASSTYVFAPSKIGDMTQAYRYGFSLGAPVPEVLKASFEAEEYLFDVKQTDGITYAMLGGQVAGIVNERCDMISDWIQKELPFRLFLNNYTECEDCKVILLFYKDKSAAHKWREQSVVSLTAYKGKARQEISAYLDSKDEVKIGDEYFGNDDDDAVVTYNGEAIGKVPPKICKRIVEDNYAFAEIEEIIQEENSSGDEVYHPVIRIYW